MARIIVFLIAFLLAIPIRAIETNETTGAYDTTAPTSTDIPDWNTGWGADSVTGWNYVGEVNGASGVYIGNGWVLTAGHVGFGNFTLGGVTYTAVANSSQSISNSKGTADLLLFQIASPPELPSLTLSTGLPVAFSSKQTGSLVAMLGFGGGYGLTWGLDTATEINELITPGGYTYVSTDFFTDNGQVVRGSSSITNNATLVDGDSGGGNFTYNATTRKWELTGINEVTGSYSDYSGNYAGNGTFSGMVQLNIYATQINAIVNTPPVTDTPTMPLPALFVMACLLLLAASHSPEIKRVRD